jgi:hypothetical protein
MGTTLEAFVIHADVHAHPRNTAASFEMDRRNPRGPDEAGTTRGAPAPPDTEQRGARSARWPRWSQ